MFCGAAGAFLAWLAVSNCWNPVGWVACAGALAAETAVAGVGFYIGGVGMGDLIADEVIPILERDA